MITSGLLVASLAAAASASGPYRSLHKRQSSDNSTQSAPTVTGATYDGQCFYPKPTDDFVLDEYLGRWYQVAGKSHRVRNKQTLNGPILTTY